MLFGHAPLPVTITTAVVLLRTKLTPKFALLIALRLYGLQDLLASIALFLQVQREPVVRTYKEMKLETKKTSMN